LKSGRFEGFLGRDSEVLNRMYVNRCEEARLEFDLFKVGVLTKGVTQYTGLPDNQITWEYMISLSLLSHTLFW